MMTVGFSAITKHYKAGSVTVGTLYADTLFNLFTAEPTFRWNVFLWGWVTPGVLNYLLFGFGHSQHSMSRLG